MTDEQADWLIDAFSRIADALDRAYPKPPMRPIKEATVTHILSDEEKLRLEQQGDSEDEIEIGGRRWDEPGPRESDFMGSAERSK